MLYKIHTHTHTHTHTSTHTYTSHPDTTIIKHYLDRKLVSRKLIKTMSIAFDMGWLVPLYLQPPYPSQVSGEEPSEDYLLIQDGIVNNNTSN